MLVKQSRRWTPPHMPKFSAALLVTRPAAAGIRFVAQLAPHDLSRTKVILSPLLEIAPTDVVPDTHAYAGVIFTSAQAIPLATHASRRPAYCVGPETAHKATDDGWTVPVQVADANELVQALLAKRVRGDLLHICGAHRIGNIAQRLSGAGLQADECVVYDQKTAPLNVEAKSALCGSTPIVAPLFSPRTAQAFASNARGTAPLHLVAMSEACLAPAAHLTVASSQIAQQPTGAAMREAVIGTLRRVEAHGSTL